VLGEQKSCRFIDIVCGSGPSQSSTFALTTSGNSRHFVLGPLIDVGLLVRLNISRIIDKCIDLKASCALSLAINDGHVLCGCADGIIRLFASDTLQCVMTLPLPDPFSGSFRDGIFHSGQPNSCFPHVIALGMDMNTEYVSCLYNDRSLRVWHVVSPKEVRLFKRLLYHSAAVTSVVVCDQGSELSLNSIGASSFLTCSADRTMRRWTASSSLASSS
jgi:hypothetical protein